ncbi:hypothetical protein ES703_122906 [subsurface metagenome]
MTADFEQFKAMFPLLGRFTERYFRRVEALRNLKWTRREEDEATQLKKLEARTMLKALVRLEEHK